MKKLIKTGLIVLAAVLGIILGMFVYKNTDIQGLADKKRDEQLQNDIVIKVADMTVSKTEAVAYLEAMKDKTEGIYGTEVWGYRLDSEGTEFYDTMKQGVLEKLIYIKIICANADVYGVKLTAADELNIDEYVADFFAGINEETAEKYNLTETVVRRIYEENVLADKVYESITLSHEVKADEEKCRQADFQVIEIDKFLLDGEGTKIFFDDEKLEEAEKKAQEAAAELSAGIDFESAALLYSDNSQTEITCGASDLPLSIAEQVMALKEGESSGVLETTDSFLIYRCVSEKNQQATEEAVEKAIKEGREEYFSSLFALWKDGTDIEINQKLWDSL